MKFTVNWYYIYGRTPIEEDDGSDTGDGMVDLTEAGESFTVEATSPLGAICKAQEEVKKKHSGGVVNFITSVEGQVYFPSSFQK